MRWRPTHPYRYARRPANGKSDILSLGILRRIAWYAVGYIIFFSALSYCIAADTIGAAAADMRLAHGLRPPALVEREIDLRSTVRNRTIAALDIPSLVVAP